MPLVYAPSGKSREYSPLACNIYLSCSHKCKYCYAPGALYRTADEYFLPPMPRTDMLAKLKAELSEEKYDKQIMLSLIGDLYCETVDRNHAARVALRYFLEHGAPVAVLTKGGERCLKDIEILSKFGHRIQVGASLTFWDESKSKQWEEGAALPLDRLETLKVLREKGIKTFACFEPVIDPAQSLAVLKKSLEMDCVDTYKIGKLNSYNGLDRNIDWTIFLKKCLALLRWEKKNLYIKQSLRMAAPSVELTNAEKDPDLYNTQV